MKRFSPEDGEIELDQDIADISQPCVSVKTLPELGRRVCNRCWSKWF
ncbi:hypothetical protein OK016_00290 [Vibrio chagasii]|nr:hypothetical protein [Vibrio chagasii]